MSNESKQAPRHWHTWLSHALSAQATALTLYLLLRLTLGDNVQVLALLHTFAFWLFLPVSVTFPLALFTRRRRVSYVQGFLALIAFFWLVDPYFVKAPPHTSSNAPTLEVLTFNTWATNTPLAPKIDYLLRSDADVIILQELLASVDDPNLDRLRETYPHWAMGANGLALFSQHPLREVEFVVLERRPGRFAQRAVLDWDGRALSVYGIHLSLPMRQGQVPLTPRADYQRERFPVIELLTRYDERRRNQQIDALLNHIADDPNPVIVAGDFNTSATSPVYRRLQAHLTDAFLTSGYGFGFSWPTSDALGWPALMPPLLRIDYIWHSDELMSVRASVDGYQGSDHFPLRAALQWADEDA